MSLFNIMEWKNVKVFKLSSAFRASAESLVTIGRRGSNLSEIFGVCGPDNVVPAPIGLGTIEEKDPLPTDEELEALYKLNLMDRTRVKTPFADLVRSNGSQRNIIVFIRHFFCPVRILYRVQRRKTLADTRHRTASDTSRPWPTRCRRRSWHRWTRRPPLQSSAAETQFSSKTT